MTSAKNTTVSFGDGLLPEAEQKRIRDLLKGVGKVYKLNGWRSVDWLGYCMDPHGQVHRCGEILAKRLLPTEQQLGPQAQRGDIPNWSYRLHNRH